MEKDRKETVVFYESWHQFLKQFPPEKYVEYMDLIMSYAFDAELPVTTDPTFFGFFWGIKPVLDANYKKWVAQKKANEERKKFKEEQRKMKIKTSDGKTHENI